MAVLTTECGSDEFVSCYSATWPEGVRRLADAYLSDPFQVFVGSLDLAVSIMSLQIQVGIGPFYVPSLTCIED